MTDRLDARAVPDDGWQTREKLPGFFIIGILAIIILTFATGFWFYSAQEKRITGDTVATLEAIATLKANQIVEWRRTSVWKTAMVLASPELVRSLNAALAKPEAAGSAELRNQLRANRDRIDFHDILLVDPSGKPLVSATGSPGPLQPESMAALAEAVSKKETVLSDLYKDQSSGTIFIDTVAPVFGDSPSGPRLLGGIVFRDSADHYLFPLIQTWPTPSRSAETLLVRRDGDYVLYLNELRHRTNTAFNLRIPLSQTSLPAVKAVLGQTSAIEGSDYRNIRVFAVNLPIADSSWYVISKIDRSEAMAEWLLVSRMIVGMVLFLALAFIFLFLMLWQRSRTRYFRERRKVEERYRITLMSVGDGVIATDAEGRIELMNPVAQKLTGWTLDESRGRPLEEVFRLIHETTREKVENPVRQVISSGTVASLANHTLLLSRDGPEIPIADSGAPIRDQNGVISGAVLVFRDQTQERAIRLALQKSEGQYRQITESSIDFIYSYDLQGRFTSVNRSLCDSMELEPGEIIGKTHAELGFPQNLCDEWTSLHRRVLETGERVYAKTQSSVMPSEQKYWEVFLNPMRGDDGVILGIAGITRDMTERQIAENAMKESEERLSAFMEYMPSLVLIKDIELRPIYANRKMRGVFPIDEWMGKRPEECFPPDIAREMIAKDTEAFDSGHTEYQEVWRDKNGVDRTLITQKFRIDRPDGPASLGMITTDITEIKRTQEELRELGEIFRIFLAKNPIYVFIKDKDMRVLYLSDNYEKMLGIPASEAIGKTMDELFPPELAEKMVKDDKRILEEGVPVEIQEELGGRTYSTVKFSIILDEGKRYLAGYTTDITERIQATRQLESLNETLEEKVKDRTSLLQAANSELEAFAYSVSHDLRTPLRALDGFSNSLLADYSDKIDEEGQHYLKRIQEGARRMGQLINDLLNLSRVTRADFEPREVSLAAIASELVAAMRAEEPQRNVDVSIAWPLRAKGDYNLLRIVLTNLLSNAWKFTSRTEGARIELGETRVDGQKVFFVRDNGIGFKMEYSKKLFRPFERLHGIYEFPGTGIGLATVQRIINRHGGRIWAEAEEGKGAIFNFTLEGSTAAQVTDTGTIPASAPEHVAENRPA